MQRRAYLLPGLALGAAVAAVWSFAGNPADPKVAALDAKPMPQTTPAPAAVNANSKPSVHATKSNAQWIADTASGDAATRAAAIEALSAAPRVEALPVLARILMDGEPQVDRVLALRSLRDLALNQGDADGAIRDAIRHAIYHGDDQTRAEDVQEALDTIEESLQKP
jgi:hypothetical protein